MIGEPNGIAQKRMELAEIYGRDIYYLGWFSIDVMYLRHTQGKSVDFWLKAAKGDKARYFKEIKSLVVGRRIF